MLCYDYHNVLKRTTLKLILQYQYHFKTIKMISVVNAEGKYLKEEYIFVLTCYIYSLYISVYTS